MMVNIMIDPLDGKGEIQIIVDGFVNARRIEEFVKWAKVLSARLADANDRINELEANHG